MDEGDRVIVCEGSGLKGRRSDRGGLAAWLSCNEGGEYRRSREILLIG